MTVPGLGGQQAPPQNAAPAAQLVPGVQPGTTAVFTQLRAGNTIINQAGLFIYSSTPAANNLVLSVSGTVGGGTDQFGNHYVFGVGIYDNSSNFFSQLGAGFTTFGTGTLAGGWTANATVENDISGDLVLAATAHTLISTTATQLNSGATSNVPDTLANPGHQSAAPATYSQSYENATTNRLNDVMDVLAATGIWPF